MRKLPIQLKTEAVGGEQGEEYECSAGGCGQ